MDELKYMLAGALLALFSADVICESKWDDRCTLGVYDPRIAPLPQPNHLPQ